MLPKQYRLCQEKDFKKIWEKGRSFYTKILGVKLLKNNLPFSRFGIIVGLKISKKTTVRNKIKRQIREILRLNLPNISPGYDLIITALPTIVGKKYQTIEKDILSAFKNLKLLKI